MSKRKSGLEPATQARVDRTIARDSMKVREGYWLGCQDLRDRVQSECNCFERLVIEGKKRFSMEEA